MAAVSQVLVLFLYLLIFVVIGIYEYRQDRGKTPADFFLAGRGLGTIVLVLTIFATLQSAWSYFGAPGFTYATGYALIAFAAANVSVVFLYYLIGVRAWSWGKRLDFISPAEMFRERYDSEWVGLLFLIFMVAWTLPYIAIQPLVGGMIFEFISDGMISHNMGVAIIIAVMTGYALVAGMRGVAWTDSIQAVFMFVFIFSAAAILISYLGGLSATGATLSAEIPEALSAPGPIGFWTLAMVTSWILLITINVPLQPHIFVRFMAADSVKVLKKSSLLYGIIAALYYVPIVLIGIIGIVVFPDIANPDDLFLFVTEELLTPIVMAIFLGAVLSALISTADSQLLVLSQMVTRDFYKEYINPDASPRHEAYVGKLLLVILAILGGLIATLDIGFIIEFGGEAFAGIGVITPAALAGLYWERATAPAAIASVVIGEAIVIGFFYGVIPATFMGPFHLVIPALLASTIVMIVVSFVTQPADEETLEVFFPTTPIGAAEEPTAVGELTDD